MQTSRILTLLLLALSGCALANQVVFPGDHWLTYDNPAEQGWSIERLEALERRAREVGVASYMIVESGYVVAAWGDPARRFKCHSVRKSFLSSLFGIQVGRGVINPDATMGELGVEDVHDLLPAEKSATVMQLLQARSGVYHPAAYETARMKARRPARGSHPPGTNYSYNNWDFNTLAGIFELKTGIDVHSAFANDIAGPLGLEDFRPSDTYYHLEAEASRYPAYPLRLSTRDAARFGLLYLAGGTWNGEQVVPADWVRKSAVAYSTAVRSARGYGLLWWVSEDPELGPLGMYHASGVGGQVIAVIPAKDLVVVQRVDTFRGDSVGYRHTLELMKGVIAAKVSGSRGPVSASPLDAGHADGRVADAGLARSLAGTYAGANGGISADVSVDSGPVVRVAWHGSEKLRNSGGVHRFHEGQEYRIVQVPGGGLELEDTGYAVQVRQSDDGQVVALHIDRPNVPLTLHRQEVPGD